MQNLPARMLKRILKILTAVSWLWWVCFTVRSCDRTYMHSIPHALKSVWWGADCFIAVTHKCTM